MASNITLSAGVRQNLLSLQGTADLMSSTQNRLATGKKVNSALDNPTNFFTSSSLQSRAGDMSSLLDSMSNGIKTLEAADNGLSSITDSLESMQSTLRQARQDKTFQTASYTVDPATVNAGTGDRDIKFSGGAVGDVPVSVELTKAKPATSTAAAAFDIEAINTGATELEKSKGATAAATAVWTDLDMTAAPDLDFTIQGSGDAAATTISLDTTTLGTTDTAVDLDEALAVINQQLADGGSSVRARESSTTANTLEFYDTDKTQVGTSADITITANADTATLNLTADATTNTVAAGVAADEVTFTVNNIDITLNGDDHRTAAAAAKAINDQIAASTTATDEDKTIKASVNADGKLTIAGPTDGSALTVAGTNATDVFGTQVTTAAQDAGTAGGIAKTVDELVSEINGNTDLKGKIRASNDNGKLRIENLSTQELAVDGVSSSGAVDGTSSKVSEIGGNTVRADLAKQFNELRDQLDKFADDASFNGINLLRGDNLKLTFNETGTSSIDIQTKEGKSINSAELGLENIEAKDLDSDAAIDSLLDGVKSALGTIRSQSSSFGSNLSVVENRTQFTKSMVNTLQTGADALVLADTNEEAANMLALQTRQQLSSTALSMASQADQAVLRLF